MAKLNQLVAAVCVIAVAGSVVLGLALIDARQARALTHLAAQDSLEQGIDLNRIVSFKYVDSKTLSVTDEKGNEYRMRFVGACPGLKEARDFSMATESFRNMDRFTGIVLNGQFCAFKDFSQRLPL